MGARRRSDTLSAAVLLALLVACGPPAGPTTATPGGTTPATTTPAGSRTASLTQAVPPSSDWRTFTTSDGQLSFDYPAAWTVKDPGPSRILPGRRLWAENLWAS
jgi:hypothetical protein